MKWWHWALIGIAAIVLIVGLYFLGLSLLRPTFDIRRAAIKRSHQYTETKISMLMQLYEEWLKPDLLPAQKQYLEARMRLEASRIDPGAVPREVYKIIGGTR